MGRDPLAGQIHMTSLVRMEKPWEDQVPEDRLAMILQIERGHSLVWDQIADWAEMTLTLQAMVKSLTLMVIHWEEHPQRIPWGMGLTGSPLNATAQLAKMGHSLEQMEGRDPSLVLEGPLEELTLEDSLVVSLQTEKDRSME